MATVHYFSRTELLARVTLGWRALLRAGSDLSPRGGARGARDQALADALVRSALARAGDRDARAELETAAAGYAHLERHAEPDPRAVFGELAKLRTAVWVQLRDCFPPGAERVAFLKSLDHAVMTALRVAVRGRGVPGPRVEGAVTVGVGDDSRQSGGLGL